jgi:sulfoxide reductase catalytic subunit YedY
MRPVWFANNKLIILEYHYCVNWSFLKVYKGSLMEKELRDEITPENLYYSRRKFFKLAGLFGVAYALAACGIKPDGLSGTNTPTHNIPTPAPGLTDQPNSYETITNYNNYYEFSFEKEGVGGASKNLVTSPWAIEISGLIDKPMTIDAADLLKKYPSEKRVYRLRCVEGWSMVIPWNGFSLSSLLNDIGVKPEGKFVKFTTLYDPGQMPGQKDSLFAWPFVEGLRLDEAMHNLTILAGGLYGKPLPPQEGAPIRLVVPWKYGFKSIKAIVKIEVVADQPATFWTISSPSEYGFYSNVNPDVPHQRWSQATERRIGESNRRPTLLFNGYAEVASLYEGMNLNSNF